MIAVMEPEWWVAGDVVVMGVCCGGSWCEQCCCGCISCSGALCDGISMLGYCCNVVLMVEVVVV